MLTRWKYILHCPLHHIIHDGACRFLEIILHSRTGTCMHVCTHRCMSPSINAHMYRCDIREVEFKLHPDMCMCTLPRQAVLLQICYPHNFIWTGMTPQKTMRTHAVNVHAETIHSRNASLWLPPRSPWADMKDDNDSTRPFFWVDKDAAPIGDGDWLGTEIDL